MGWFDSISNMFKRSQSSLISRIGGLEVYNEINSNKAVEKGFLSNTAVHSIVMRDAVKFGSIPRYVYDKSKATEKAFIESNILENKLSALLNRPNESQGQDAFFTEVRAWFKTCGEAFIWLNRGSLTDDMDDEAASTKPVLEMYVLPANHMIVIPDPENLFGAIGYKLDNGGRGIPFRKSDVIHWKTPSMRFDAVSRNHLRGFSALSAGYKSLQQNEDATNALVRMYQNDGAKGILSNETMDKMTPIQESQMKTVINAKINNNDQKGAVAALQGKWKYDSLGGSSIDMQLLEGKNMSWQELCFLLETPYELFDGKTAFNNKQEAKKAWVSDTIIPACKQLDGELNRPLLKAFGLEGKGFIGSDFSELPEMQDDLQKMVTALSAAWWVTPNQKLAMMNEEGRPEPEFNEPWIPTGITPLSQIGGDEEAMRSIQDQLNKMGLNDNRGNRKVGDD